MRLSPAQIQIIKQQAADLLGDAARIWLFGSRVDDNARGGDIDLYVETPQRLENRASAAARLAARLQRRLGDQRIDIIIVDSATPPQPIHEVARTRGIPL